MYIHVRVSSSGAIDGRGPGLAVIPPAWTAGGAQGGLPAVPGLANVAATRCSTERPPAEVGPGRARHTEGLVIPMWSKVDDAGPTLESLNETSARVDSWTSSAFRPALSLPKEFDALSPNPAGISDGSGWVRAESATVASSGFPHANVSDGIGILQ